MKTDNKLKTKKLGILDKIILFLGIVLIIQAIAALVVFKVQLQKYEKSTESSGALNSEAIQQLSSDYGATLAIPQVIQGSEDFYIDNYRNIMAIITAGDNRLGIAKFTDARACPLGVYITEEDSLIEEKFYTTEAIDVDFIRVRIAKNKSYLTYKFDYLAYTLEINKSCSLSELLSYLGLTTNDVVETTYEGINNNLGVSKEDTTETTDSNGVFGKYAINLELDTLGMTYGIDQDETVNFYLDNLIVMQIQDNVDKYKNYDNVQIKQCKQNEGIYIIRYAQKYELGTQSYETYIALDIICSDLLNSIDYAS